MNKRSRYIIGMVLFILFISVGFLGTYSFNPVLEIEKVLKGDDYSYLPDVALEYIKSVYEETGELILTEKNKKENEPYLNPGYIEYLNYSNEYKTNFGYIPNEMVIDYVYYGDDGLEHEAYYNITSIDTNNDGVVDKNYTTPMKNQGSLGLCWAYTIAEVAETYLMNEKQETYQEGITTMFSPRHLDYASANGIIDYTNNYSNHSLGGGSNFEVATKVLTVGLSLFDTSWKYNNLTSLQKLEYIDVFNDSYSKYELEETIEMPVLNVASLNLNNSSDLQRYNTYINTIKTNIKKYGSLYVGTQAPGYSCSAINVYDTNHRIIDSTSSCTKDGNHAMQIIGWDDNYQYKYCVSGKRHVKWTSSCSESNTVEGKGVWILRNSWGNHSDKYTYLTYNSVDSDYGFISSLVSSSDKEWDYVYDEQSENISFSKEYVSSKYNYIIGFNSLFEVNAKLIKIKFRNSSQNVDYDIYVSESGKDEDYKKVISKNVKFPGYVTIDLSDENYAISSNSKIKIISAVSNLNSYNISVFTKENTSNKYIFTEDKVYYETDDVKVDDLYEVRLYSETYNIETNENVSYKLYDQTGYDITNKMVVKNNVVGANKLNTILQLPNIGDASYFTVNAFYDNELMSSVKLTTDIPKPEIGSGTKDDPYVIMSADDLYSINYNLSSHFVLGTDIDLTFDTQDENGKYYNRGKGWESIGYATGEYFLGSLDGYYNGEYHKIIGFNQVDGAGLFYVLYNSLDDVYVKNIIFEKARVVDSPLLSYAILGDSSGKTIVENIAAIDCEFIGSSRFIAWNIASYSESAVVLNSIFSSSTYTETDSVIAGLAQTVEVDDSVDKNASVDVKNIQLLDRVDNSNSYYYTALFRFSSGKLNIENVIFNNNTKYTPYLFARLNKSTGGNQAYLKNGYYLDSVRMIYFTDSNYYDISNFVSKDINGLKEIKNYNDWTDFDKYWVMDKVDGVSRYPILKFVPFEYTKIDDIDMMVGDQVNIYDYINPKITPAQNIEFNVIDSSLVSISSDGTITALSAGSARIHVVNRYDGYEDDIVINVLSDTGYTIKFDGNGASGYMDNLSVVSGQKIVLPKNTFVMNGYKFLNWNTKADGSGKKYNDCEEIIVTSNLNLYAIWEVDGSYEIKVYDVDEENKYIDMIDVYTSVDDFKSNIKLFTGYTVEVDSVNIGGKEVIYTGGKTRIYKNNVLYVEYSNIVRGDVTGDGYLDYLDYVYIYNHIYKTNHPEVTNKTLLEKEYLLAADAYIDDMVDYLDYVRIYNLIKQMKGESN